MKKRILCLVMAAIMTVGTSINVFAEKVASSKDWLVEFDGKKMNSNFEASDVMYELYQLLPGDTMEIQIGVKNSSSDETDWYMTNEVLQSLEASQKVANGGAYEYRLVYLKPGQEEKVFYDSETVGGEGSTAAGEGLEQATHSLKDYFYLDRLKKDEVGSVHLLVTLEGETQGNDYQDTLAKLHMNFAVEKVTSNKIIITDPKTGDSTKVIGFCALALGSGLLLLWAGISSTKKKRKDRKGEQ